VFCGFPFFQILKGRSSGFLSAPCGGGSPFCFFFFFFFFFFGAFSRLFVSELKCPVQCLSFFFVPFRTLIRLRAFLCSGTSLTVLCPSSSAGGDSRDFASVTLLGPRLFMGVCPVADKAQVKVITIIGGDRQVLSWFPPPQQFVADV